jgi:hypothetical protein
MARILTEGFELQDMVGFSTSTIGSISTSVKRSGNASLTLAGGKDLTYSFPASYSEFYIRAGIYLNTINGLSIRWYKNSVELGSIRTDTSGSILIYTSTGTLRATGTTPLSTGIWYLIEIKVLINDTTGSIEVKLDGASEVSFSGDTKPGTDTDANVMKFYGLTSNGFNLDDVALNDTSGGADNSWCGDGKIIMLIPNGNGDASGLTGSDGNSTDNYLLVDEAPSDDDTTYVEGTVVDTEDLYALSNMTVSGITIKRVWVAARAKDTVASGREISLNIKPSGGTTQLGTSVALLDSYTKNILGDYYTTNPVTTSAWQISELDSLQAGVRIRS